MHAGNIFSSLIAWIIVRRYQGEMLLRIEDLDPGRSRKEYADQIQFDLELLGLTWDREPIYQSERTEAYQEAFDRLAQRDLIYPCVCTRNDLHATQAPHEGDRFIYPGTCRYLDSAELALRKARRRAQGSDAAYRVIVPRKRYSVNDMLQGAYSLELSQSCGDFIVRRSDGAYAYQLAVVVDDAEYHVNSIVRGVDLLSSTPQQMYLQDMLGYEHPSYAHVPLFVAAPGKRLAKRDKSASLEEMLSLFKTPEGVLGHIAYKAGIYPLDEPVSADILLKEARLEALSRTTEIVFS